ncbi:MAG: hypothetical protein GY865_03810 [candidate division Zixibacteria bacterium]|nr:hypothetical protein [candidate division Zixibacteria bacterium]
MSKNLENKFYSILLLLTLLFLSLSISCGKVYVQKRELVSPDNTEQITGQSKYLKAHMYNGQVYILSDWIVDSANRIVFGSGELLDINRYVISEGQVSISLDSVAIFETNVNSVSGGIGALTILTGFSAAATVYCIANPKACFGSCPTFYAFDGKDDQLMAEGFSSSVAPALEKSDIDALYRAVPSGNVFKLTMTNEAPETHMVRYADILAVPHFEGNRVFVTEQGDYYQTNKIVEPTQCKAEEGDCLNELKSFDDNERKSLADSVYLGDKEEIELEFDPVSDGDYGLVISSRQSLMSTYLFYQALSYMGSRVGEYFAAMERLGNNSWGYAGGIGKVLGGVEVFLLDSLDNWQSAGKINETGPLATDTKIIPLPQIQTDKVRIKLRFTRGYIRLDYTALARLEKMIKPIRLHPSIVYRDNVVDEKTKSSLLDKSELLITMPGDVYTLDYQLPVNYQDYELFLESRGYYLEWMRDEWQVEENSELAMMMLFTPEQALRYLAPEFKQAEPYLEEMFWNSKYVK